VLIAAKVFNFHIEYLHFPEFSGTLCSTSPDSLLSTFCHVSRQENMNVCISEVTAV